MHGRLLYHPHDANHELSPTKELQAPNALTLEDRIFLRTQVDAILLMNNN